MSGIYIKGMEMPVFEHQSWDIRRGANGKWYVTDTNAETSDGEWHEIVPVPLHGRLIDADALASEIQKSLDKDSDNWLSSPVRMAERVVRAADLKKINSAPTIISADSAEEEKKG